MIKIIWKSTGAICTTFRKRSVYLNWLRTRGGDGVTRRAGTHHSVDLRDVETLGSSLTGDCWLADSGDLYGDSF